MAKNINSEKSLRVRRGRVDSVNLYEVKENELDLLENGEQIGLQLNFSIFLLSTAFSGILTLCTASFSSALIQNIFLFVSIIGCLLGFYLLLMWLTGRKSIKSVIQIIKNRISSDLFEEETECETYVKSQNRLDDYIKPEG